ncbi:MAG: hypothetical protein H0T62_04390 [Parachlamydiaceae bacterium]|nr:hypothetical protein [Parachlamydiaceae bacterium]
MSKDHFSFSDKLHEILATNDYEALEPFKKPEIWQPLPPSDKELLGQFFILWGKELLNKSDPRAFDLFERALKVAGDSFKVLHMTGKAYASQKHSIRGMTAALDAFERALQINSDAFEVSHDYLQTLIHKGVLVEDESYFIRAIEKCRQIEAAAIEQKEAVRVQFFWDWGKSHFHVAKRSGEAVDFYEALGKYRLIQDIKMSDPDFLKDSGDVYLQLGRLLSRESYCLEAIEFYQKSLIVAHECSETWFSLGLSYALLFENFGGSDNFLRANKSFFNAAKLDSNQLVYWFKWGQLQLECGKQQENLELIRGSIEKFARADSLEAHHPVVLCAWGEALLVYGTFTEEIGSLKNAERKIAESLALNPENEMGWHVFGCCYNELGRYFNDENFYFEAMAKFRHGLALNKNSALLWHGLAYSNFALGEFKNDLSFIEKSCQLCARAMENGALSQAQCWNDWGVALMKMGEILGDKQSIESALEKFENAMNLQNSWGNREECDVELLYNYGCALDFLGDFSEDPLYYEKSVQVLQKVLHTDPSHPHARYNLALALLHLGERISDAECLGRAAEQFEVIISLDPEDEMAWNECGLALLNLAELVHDAALPYKSRHYFELAEIKFHQAVALGCIQAYYSSACFYSLIGNYPEALFFLEKAEHFGALPPIDEIMNDDWLFDLRQTEGFQGFISRHQQDEKSG